jgi:hypothetical protein
MLEASGKLGDGTSRRRMGQRARRYTTRFHELEHRKLLSSTTLVWDVGVSLASARGTPAAYSGPSASGVPAIIVAGCQTPGDPTAVNELGSLSSWWTSDSKVAPRVPNTQASVGAAIGALLPWRGGVVSMFRTIMPTVLALLTSVCAGRRRCHYLIINY